MEDAFAIEAVFPRVGDALDLPAAEFMARAEFTRNWHQVTLTKEQAMEKMFRQMDRDMETAARG
jgi:hypothetical protein